jgi:hypothetical protein
MVHVLPWEARRTQYRAHVQIVAFIMLVVTSSLVSGSLCTPALGPFNL